MEQEKEIVKQLQKKIKEDLNFAEELSDEQLKELIGKYLLEKEKKYSYSLQQRKQIGKEIFDSFRKLDILQDLIDDDEITEIMVNGPEDIFIEILDTTFYNEEENNARSIVCVLNAYGVRTLFTGDADNGAGDLEGAYMNSVGNIDILKLVHHGTREGTTSEFLKAVDPEVCIVTNGNYFGNKHGHPTYEALSRIYAYDENINVYAVVGGDADNCELSSSNSYHCEPTDYTMDRNGMITITIDNNGYTINSEYFDTNKGLVEIRDTEFWAARSQIG